MEPRWGSDRRGIWTQGGASLTLGFGMEPRRGSDPRPRLFDSVGNPGKVLNRWKAGGTTRWGGDAGAVGA